MTALLSAVQTLRRMVLEANMVFQRLWKRTGSCHWRFYEKAISSLFTSQRVVYTYRCTLPSVMQCAIWTVQNCIGCEKKEDAPLFRWSVTTGHLVRLRWSLGHLVRLIVQDIGGDPDFSNDGRSWSFCFALYIGDGWIFYENCENVADSLEFSLILVTISVTKLTIYKFFTNFRRFWRLFQW